MANSTVRWWVSLGAAGVLLFVPAGNFSPGVVLDKLFFRIANPVTAEEARELDMLSCIEQTAAVIPDLATVKKEVQQDEYLLQRVGDIMYPRIRFEADAAKAQYTLYVNVDPGQTELINSADCQGLFVGVAKNA